MSDALVVIDALNPVTIFGTEKGVDDVLAKLRADALAQAQALNIATETGRKAIASLAFKVARSKTALDDMGKSLVSDWKARAAKVDEERRRIRDECDRIKDEVRKPLDDYEAEVKAFNEKWKAECMKVSALGEDLDNCTISALRERLRDVANYEKVEWPLLYKFAAEKNAKASRAILERAVQEAEERERQEAQRRAEEAKEAARLQAERDARIAAEAKERAEREAQAALEREQARVEREKAKRAADAVAAKEKAEREATAAKERQKVAVEQAAQRERERIAKEQERERLAAEKREANERNRRKVSRAISDALFKETGILATQCDLVLDALVAGKIPHVTIQW